MQLIKALIVLVLFAAPAAAQTKYDLVPFQCPTGQFVYGFNPAAIGLPGWFCAQPPSGGGGGGGISGLTPNFLTKALTATSIGNSSIFDAGLGVTVGSPTGGAQGAGTVNATGLFVNGVAVGLNGTINPGGPAIAVYPNNGTAISPGTLSANFALVSGQLQLAPINNNTVLGNVSGSIAVPGQLTSTQLTTLCNLFTNSLSGCVPASGGGTTNFMRADGTWAAPPGGAAYNPTARQVTSGATDTATSADYQNAIFWKSATTSAKTETFPGCVAGNNGKWIVLADEQGTAAAYPITVVGSSGTVGGSASGVTISSNLGGVRFNCDGTNNNWVVESVSFPGTNVRAASGTSDTILATDNGNMVTECNASPVAVTLPQGGTTGFPTSGFTVVLRNYCAGTVTVTPNTSTINNGAANLVLFQNQSAIVSLDGSNNYQVASIVGTASPIVVSIPNDTVTGTAINLLAKSTNAPSNAVVTATTDTIGALGVVVAGAGKSGSALIANEGIVPCTFDGATTAGHYVIISNSVAGDCKDGGVSFPTNIQTIGIVLSTNASGGTYNIMMGPGVVSATGNNGGTGLSGMTAGQAAIAGTATTVTSSQQISTTGNNVILETDGSGNEKAPVNTTTVTTSGTVTLNGTAPGTVVGSGWLGLDASNHVVSGTPTGAGSGWTVIVPTGVVATDQAALTAAIASGLNVWMQPGNSLGVHTPWALCKQFNLQPSQIIAGPASSPNPGSADANVNYALTYVKCPVGQGTWSSGQAFFKLSDSDVIQNISIYGNIGDATQPLVDCYFAGNVLYPRFDGANCYHSTGHMINLFSDGAVPGPSIAYSQGAIITNSQLYFPAESQAIIYADYANGEVNGGGFVSDIIIGPNNDISGGGFGGVTTAAVYLHTGPFAVAQVHNNRIEDGAMGVAVINGGYIAIVDNNCDKQECVYIQNSSNISIVGNRGGNNWNLFLGTAAVEFNGTNSAIQSAGNNWEGSGAQQPCYNVDAGATITNSTFSDTCSGGYLYAGGAGSYTERIMSPFVPGTFLDRLVPAQVPLVGSTFTPVNFANKDFLFFVPSSCSPCTVDNPPAPLGTGQHGYFYFVQDPTGGGTVNFGALYNQWQAPTLSKQPNAVDIIEYKVGITGIVLEQMPYSQNSPYTNSLSGGAGMTSGWGTAHATLANAVGGCTDPVGGSACSTITEDSTFNTHQVAQSLSQSGINLMNTWVNAGTPAVSAVVTATFSTTNQIMNVTGVTSGTVSAHGQMVSCSCAANGVIIVGYDSGAGGVGTYFTKYGVNVASPTLVNLIDVRFLYMAAYDNAFANSAAVGFNPNPTPQAVGLVNKDGSAATVGQTTGTGSVYNAFYYNLPGTTWYRLVMIYGGFTTSWDIMSLGLLQQTAGFDQTDYTGDGVGFLQLWGPQYNVSSPEPTGILNIPVAVAMTGLSGSSPIKSLCLDASNDVVSTQGSCNLSAGATAAVLTERFFGGI